MQRLVEITTFPGILVGTDHAVGQTDGCDHAPDDVRLTVAVELGTGVVAQVGEPLVARLEAEQGAGEVEQDRARCPTGHAPAPWTTSARRPATASA